MPQEAKKIAVVGAGLIGRKHIELATETACLSAIVDPDVAAQELAVTVGVPWFRSLPECLENMHTDGAIIASPNQLHLQHGTQCLQAGVPVLIEKPLADTSDAALKLARLSDETNVPILVGHHRRHSPVIHAAKEILESGQLGEIVATHASFLLNKPDGYFDVAWRKQTGGGPIYINLIHDIDLLQYLCGPISTVQANEARKVRGFDVEDTAAAVLTYENGALGTVTISDAVSSPWSWELTSGENPAYPKTDQSCYMIMGTQGSLSLPDLKVWSHTGEQSWWSPIEASENAVAKLDPVAEQLKHFMNVIEGRSAPLVTAWDGLRNIEVLDAFKAAATTLNAKTVGNSIAS